MIPIPNFVPSNNMGLQGLINDAYAAMPFSAMAGQSGPVAMVPGASAPADAMPGGVLGQQFGRRAAPGRTPMGGDLADSVVRQMLTSIR